jgi:DNA-binding IclR family transcriptional regulator
MGYSALGEETLVEKALGSMRALRDRYGETVPLGVLHGNEGVVVEEIPGVHPFRFVLAPGKPFHLHTSAPGKAMVAFLPEGERKTLMAKIEYKRFNEKTIRNIGDYRKKLEEVRKKGYAVDFAEEIEGMHCIGAPIFNRRGYPIAAIWLTGPSFRLEPINFESIGKEVKKYADIISQSLGYGLLNGVPSNSKT